MYFQDEKSNLFFLKIEALRSKSVNQYVYKTRNLAEHLWMMCTSLTSETRCEATAVKSLFPVRRIA